MRDGRSHFGSIYSEGMYARVAPVAPFDLEMSLRFVCHPPRTVAVSTWEPGADVWTGREYRRVIWLGGRPLLLLLRNAGLVDQPALDWRAIGATLNEAEQKAVNEIIRHMLSAEVDLAPFYARARLDPVLNDLRDQYYGLKVIRFPSLYECLVSTVLEQQINLPFAATLKRRLLKTFGPVIEHEGGQWHGYPSPETLARLIPDQLRPLQISERKASYIIGIARAYAEGKIDEAGLRRETAEKAVETLTEIRGVGRWTAEYSLLRGLGHTDVLPADDVGLQRTAGLLYGLKAPATAMSIRRRWKRLAPWQGYAALYLWFTYWGRS